MNAKDALKGDQARLLLEEKERIVSKKYGRAVKELSALEKEMLALLDIRESTATHAISPRLPPKKSEATAIVVASDWHVEETVNPKKVSDLNRYNLDIAKSRATQFFQRAVKLTKKEQQDIPIKTMVLAILGDMISGNIHEELLSTCSPTS